MNSLELIIQNIIKYEAKIQELKTEAKRFDDYDDRSIEIDFMIEEYEDILEPLYQIKVDLEAWEVVKNSKIQVEETFVDKNGNDNIVINLIFKEKDFGKFEKGLETVNE